ncbi:HAD family hydrolase [Deinococcus deserti]|uniref:HAD family hydrolase n=1 Tax=Deinococcus deserti TaxID=310783 RepID=UPI001F581DA5|nr:HAD family hydrolase [Deinococcus deserti]
MSGSALENLPAYRPLLVLDLDETLWHGIPDPPVSEGHRFLVRPYLESFLEAVADHYDLAVWTAASEDWMRAGLRVIAFETQFDLAGRAFFLWHRDRCTWRRTEEGEGELRKPARKFRARWVCARYPAHWILVVDDLASNDLCGSGHLVRVGMWTGDQEDDELRALAAYLTAIVHEPDLRQLEKRHWRSTIPRNANALHD